MKRDKKNRHERPSHRRRAISKFLSRQAPVRLALAGGPHHLATPADTPSSAASGFPRKTCSPAAVNRKAPLPLATPAGRALGRRRLASVAPALTTWNRLRPLTHTAASLLSSTTAAARSDRQHSCRRTSTPAPSSSAVKAETGVCPRRRSRAQPRSRAQLRSTGASDAVRVRGRTLRSTAAKKPPVSDACGSRRTHRPSCAAMAGSCGGHMDGRYKAASPGDKPAAV
eukprot:scaffold3356_cov112-Isochrysis_galbana.AAC.13